MLLGGVVHKVITLLHLKLILRLALVFILKVPSTSAFPLLHFSPEWAKDNTETSNFFHFVSVILAYKNVQLKDERKSEEKPRSKRISSDTRFVIFNIHTDNLVRKARNEINAGRKRGKKENLKKLKEKLPSWTRCRSGLQGERRFQSCVSYATVLICISWVS